MHPIGLPLLRNNIVASAGQIAAFTRKNFADFQAETKRLCIAILQAGCGSACFAFHSMVCLAVNLVRGLLIFAVERMQRWLNKNTALGKRKWQCDDCPAKRSLAGGRLRQSPHARKAAGAKPSLLPCAKNLWQAHPCAACALPSADLLEQALRLLARRSLSDARVCQSLAAAFAEQIRLRQTEAL